VELGVATTIAWVVFAWAASTALIFFLDSLPRRTFRWSMTAATLLLALSFAGIFALRNDSGTIAIIASFTASMLVWGWMEMSLYMGYVTGPRKQHCIHGCHGVKHFGHAVAVNLWHELAIIAGAATLWLIGNPMALWTYVMLWLMHLSARLNVFLGVRNVSAEFVPEHMAILRSFLRKRNMNPLFPFSCIGLVALTIWLVSNSSSENLAYTIAATLAVIGLLEHILLMLPLPVERLWHWSQARKAKPVPPSPTLKKKLVTKFLGA
jgi:putative photosynthetic complex assembly protein 2